MNATTIEQRPHDDIAEMMGAVEIHAHDRYTIAGQYRDFSAMPMAPSAGRPPLLDYLERDLYALLYVRPSSPVDAPPDYLAQRQFTATLSAANNGKGSWEAGWKIESIDDDGRIAVTRDRVTFWAQPAGVMTRTGQAVPGDFCRVWVMKELRLLVPGFYYAIGDGDGTSSRDTTDPLVRIYWHLKADAAVQYMALATGAFNAARIPFRTKVIAEPGSYLRADAGVLYLERRYFPRSRRLIVDIHRALGAGLRSSVPMFSRRLAEGVGVAEDPGNGLSFGQSRSNVIARALWACHERGIIAPEERLAVAAELFREEGIDPTRPHLTPGSEDLYDLAVSIPEPHGRHGWTTRGTRATRRSRRTNRN